MFLLLAILRLLFLCDIAEEVLLVRVSHNVFVLYLFKDPLAAAVSFLKNSKNKLQVILTMPGC